MIFFQGKNFPHPNNLASHLYDLQNRVGVQRSAQVTHVGAHWTLSQIAQGLLSKNIDCFLWSSQEIDFQKLPSKGALPIDGFVFYQTVKLDLSQISIAHLAVGQKGQGFGGRMLKKFEEHLLDQELNPCEIFLEVAEGNLPAQKLYQSLNFTQCGVREKYYSTGEDAWTMKKTI